jgi:DNA-directed RNA polymerase, mitochondrial
MIVRTAHNPEETKDWWSKADAPFSFVAACQEWVAATGRRYITHLPIPLDASNNGVQHLAALSRDEQVGYLTNLTGAVASVAAGYVGPYSAMAPQDAFRNILREVIRCLEAERDKTSSARFWLAENRLNRKLVKRPAGTFGYSVTVDGMRDQIVGEYQKQHWDGRGGNEPPNMAAWYLAHRVMAACREVLKKPAEVMDIIRGLAEQLAKCNQPLRWVTPTGFPVINGHYFPNIEIADLELRGERVRYRVANGWESRIDEENALNAAAPNYVHSLDASHGARVVNAAAREGIASVALIHDCFASTAPLVERLHRLVRREFYLLHAPDQLAALRETALQDYLQHAEIPDYGEWAVLPMFPQMRYGLLDLAAVQYSEYMTS